MVGCHIARARSNSKVVMLGPKNRSVNSGAVTVSPVRRPSKSSAPRGHTPLGPYRRPMPRVIGGSWVGGRFLMSEVPLYLAPSLCPRRALLRDPTLTEDAHAYRVTSHKDTHPPRTLP